MEKHMRENLISNVIDNNTFVAVSFFDRRGIVLKTEWENVFSFVNVFFDDGRAMYLDKSYLQTVGEVLVVQNSTETSA